MFLRTQRGCQEVIISDNIRRCPRATLARHILGCLSKERLFRSQVSLEEVSWDDPDAPVPMAAHSTPQAAVERNLDKSSECDVVVAVLWSRMGTPLPGTARPRTTDSRSHTAIAPHAALIPRHWRAALRPRCVLAIFAPGTSAQ